MIYLNAILTYLQLKLKLNTNRHNIWRLDFVIFCFKNKIKIIGESKQSFIVKYKLNNDLFFEIRHYPSSDFSVFNTVIIKKQYDIKLDNPKYIIDAGANVGYTALYLTDKFPLTKIISIEPFSENAQIIKNHILLNNLQNIILLEKGLWHTEEDLNLDFSYRDCREHAVRTIAQKNNTNSIVISTITLDKILTTYNIEKVDFLKIDIEGSEKQIFEDYSQINEILKNTITIAIEIHDEVASRENIEYILKSNFKKVSNLGELTIASKYE
jgi:FkbM family methyltransferase